MSRVYAPQTLSELWRVTAESPLARFCAGGTDLLVKRRAGLIPPGDTVLLHRLKELTQVSFPKDFIRIGAAVTLTDVLDNSPLQAKLPLLTKAVAQLGSPLVRNMGTIGGNIVTASPAGDTLPPLYAYNAKLELVSENGTRLMPISDFITSPGKTLLNPGEILAAIRIPTPGEWNVDYFEKVGKRQALAISLVSMAALLRVNKQGIIEDVGLAFGSVGPVIQTCPQATRLVIGRKLDLKTLKNAGSMVMEEISPIGDIRATKDYRRQVAGNLMRRLEGGQVRTLP